MPDETDLAHARITGLHVVDYLADQLLRHVLETKKGVLVNFRHQEIQVGAGHCHFQVCFDQAEVSRVAVQPVDTDNQVSGRAALRARAVALREVGEGVAQVWPVAV